MEVEKLYKPVWEQEYDWAKSWMEIMDHPPEWVVTRKKAYYAEKERESLKGVK